MGTVSSCCFGFTLAQGTVAAGVFCLIDSLITFSTGIWALNYSHSAEGHHHNLYRSDYTNYGVAALLFSSIGIVATIFLFVGVAKKQRGFLLLWIIVDGITLICGLPALIYLTTNVSREVALSVAQAIGFTFSIYLYIVVISYYKSYNHQPVYSTTYNQPGFVVQPNVAYYTTTGVVAHTNPNTKHSGNFSTHPPAESYHTPGAVAYPTKPNANVTSKYPSEPPAYNTIA